MAAMHGQAVGVSAVSRTVTDAMWKHTWSLSYVLPAEVLWHPPFDPRDKAEALKIKERAGTLLSLTGHMWRGKQRKRKQKSRVAEGRSCTRGELGQTSDQPSDETGGVGGAWGVLLEEVMRRRPPRLLHSGEV